MEKIAFISGGTFIYWSSIILALAAVTAIAFFVATYLHKSGNVTAICLMIPTSILASMILGRLIHWYCRTDSYESLRAAMTDYSGGGYALMGVFFGCLLVAGALRLLKVVKNLPEMLDCMAIAGGAGIAVGRLASLFNSSDRGVIVPEGYGLPIAYPVTNAVSGVVELRLATFMLQAILTAAIVVVLTLLWLQSNRKDQRFVDGDICLLFLAAYGASQIVFDSTRYDSLYMRSNGFISLVQILGLIALLTSIVLFSIRMVRSNGFKKYFIAIWVVIVATLSGAAYMEYYVQRHGDQALFAYTIMSCCIAVAVAATVVIRLLAVRAEKAAIIEAVETN